jgi:hypothetical protein
LFPGTAVKDGGLYSGRVRMSIPCIEIAIDKNRHPNPISIAISRKPTLSLSFSVIGCPYAVNPAKAGVQNFQ